MSIRGSMSKSPEHIAIGRLKEALHNAIALAREIQKNEEFSFDIRLSLLDKGFKPRGE
jgi:hypothetical protein